MMKKCIAVVTLLCLMIPMFSGAIPTAQATYSKAATQNTAVVESVSKKSTGTSQLLAKFKIDMTVAANADAGLEGDVTVNFPKVGYSGTLYLPGTADTDKLFFSWDDESIVVSKNGTAFESGTAPVAADGKSVKYTIKKGKLKATLTIKTIKGSEGVAAMFLNLDESLGTIDAMNADEIHETECFGSVNFDGQVLPYMSMKGRGNSTWGFDKKPYNLTFYKAADYNKKSNASLIKGVKAKKWSLLANYLDNSLMRNKVGLDLAKNLGIGLDSRFVDLWMNGEYLGNYLLTPKNDYQAPDGGYALENDNYLSSDDPQFTMDGMKEIAVTDGYYNRITVKDIGDDAADAGVDAAAIEDWFSDAWAAVLDYDSEEYQKYFDIDSWTKMYLMYETAKTYDAFSGSILMHRDGLTDDDKLIAGPAWDMDTCFGRTLYKFLSGVTLRTQLSADCWYVDSIGLSASSDPISLLQELGKHESFMKRMSEVYNDYKWAFEDISKDVDAQQALISKSAEMNNDLWGLHHLGTYFAPTPIVIGSGKYQLRYKTTTTWNAYVDNLREYVNKRVSFLSDHFYAEYPVGQVTGNLNLSAGDTLELTASLTAGDKINLYQWQSSTNGKKWADIDGATSATFETAVTEDMNGMQYRCVVKNGGVNIYTIHTGKVQASAQTTLEPVTISVSAASTPVVGEDTSNPAVTPTTPEITTAPTTDATTAPAEATTDAAAETGTSSESQKAEAANSALKLLEKLGQSLRGRFFK